MGPGFGDNGLCYVPHWYNCAGWSYVFTPRWTSPKLNTPTYSGSSIEGATVALNYASKYRDGTSDPKPNSWHVRCRLGSTGSGTIVEDKYVSSPSNITFTGLQGNTTYNFVCCARRSGFTDSDYTSRVVLTTTTARPPKFSWTHPKARGAAFNLTANEWNALCANVNAIEQYKGVGKSNLATAVKNNQVKATMFNEVRYAIGSMSSTGIQNKVAGDIVEAADMNTIVSKLNEVN